MSTSFEKVLDEVIENYKFRVEVIHQGAQLGRVASRSEMNAFIGANAQAMLVSLIKVHIKKGLVANGEDLQGFLKRAKASAVREKSTGSVAVIALCDRLLPTIKAEMKWDNSQ